MISDQKIQEWRDKLAAHYPPGDAWPRDENSTMMKQIEGAATALAYAEYRADQLLNEMIPLTTTEMLSDWEDELGLPDDCAKDANTFQERRAAAVFKYNNKGGQSVPYFQALATLLGYLVEIVTYKPFVCGLSECGNDLFNGDDLVRQTWKVRVLEPRVTWFTAGVSEFGDHLAEITRAEDLECILQRLKPAQTTLIFSYQGNA